MIKQEFSTDIKAVEGTTQKIGIVVSIRFSSVPFLNNAIMTKRSGSHEGLGWDVSTRWELTVVLKQGAVIN